MSYLGSSVFVSCLLSLSLASHAAGFKLSSPNIKHGAKLGLEQVFNGFGCSGGNQSPELVWQDSPKGSQSFALTLYDPDAPTGSGWWHWVVYNIPATSTALTANAGTSDGKLLPEGAQQGRTDFGTLGFGGACPPEGDKAHRYIFTLYALKTAKLELPANASPALIGYMIHANTLAKTSFTATYQR